MDSTRIKIGQVLYGQKEDSEDVHIVKVESVGVGGINYNDTDNSFQYSFDELYGIPVAAKVLIASGFTLINGMYVNDNIGFIKIKQINGQWFWYADKDKCILVKYLHELQGLYGELTGNVLNIDEEGLSEELSKLVVLPMPGVLVASEITQIAAKVSWGAVTGADGYKYSMNGGTSWSELVETVYVNLTELTHDTDYAIRVKAIGDGVVYSDSPASETLSFSTLDLEVLATPVPVESNVTQIAATVTWDANENAEGFKYSLNAGSTWSDLITSPTVDLTDLTADTEYSVTVKAIGDGIVYDDSLVSDALVFSTLELEVLATPSNLAESAVTQTTATVSWDANENAEGFKYSLNAGSTWSDLITSPTVDLTGLTAGAEYSVTVKAIGDGIVYDDSLVSDALVFSTLAS